MAWPRSSTVQRKLTPRHLALITLLCSSFGLLWQLDAKSLWIDELFTAEIVAQPTAKAIIAAVRVSEGRPPLYYLLLRAWTLAAGSSDFALRFFSVIPAMLCIALIYVLTRRLANRRIALTTMFLFAIAPLFLLYARMARAYFMAVCFALLTCYGFARLLKRPAPIFWIGYLLAAWGLLYTDYMTASILLVPNLIALSFWRTSRRLWIQWVGAQILLIFGFLPWMPVLLQHTARYQSPTQLADLAQGLAGYVVKLAQPILVFSLGETLHPWNPIGGIGLLTIIGLALLGLTWIWRQRQARSLFIILAIIMPILFTVFVVTGWLVRYMTFAWIGARTLQSFPFYLMLVASGIYTLRPSKIRYGGLLVITLVFLVADINYYTDRDFQNPIYVIPSKSIVAQVVAHIQADDVIIASRDSLFERYYRAHRISYPLLDSQSPDELRIYIEQNQNNRIWLITVNRDRGGIEPSSSFMEWLQINYEANEHWGYAEVTPGYRRFKTYLTYREAYQYKAELTLYARR